MIIGSRYRLANLEDNLEIKLGEHNIKGVTSKKSLGVILDCQLNWKMHIEAQSKKISKSIALLRRAKPFVPQHILVKMYNTLVLPYFTYCSTVWNDGSSTILSKLSKLQRRAARVITGQTYDVRSTQILGDLSWIPIEDTLKRREIIMSFKALTDRLPTYLQELFSKCNNDNYYLRSNNSKLALPKPKTNFLKRSFSYRAAQGWNELPNSITENFDELSLSAFKQRI